MKLFSTFIKKFFYKNSRTTQSELSKLPSFSYGFDPNAAFDSISSLLDSETIPILGYGSLLQIESACLCLGEEIVQNRTLVLASGLKRIFEKDIAVSSPNNPWILDEEKKHPCCRASLNIRVTHKDADVINGVVYHVDKKGFCSIAKREEGYDLIPIRIRIWNDRDNNLTSCLIAYVFSISHPAFLNTTILPRPSYYFKCREAAKCLGQEFYTMWLSTTFLGDATTSVKKWDASHSDSIP